jgi:ERCC4-type nuclease
MPCKPPPPPLFTVIADTREQKPWAPHYSEKGKRIAVPVERGTLTEGDYAIQGREGEVRIERKSLEDAVGTAFGKVELADGTKADSWDRFKRELERVKLGGFKRFWVFIEASRGDVYGRKYWSGVDPKSVLGRWDSLEVDHGVSVVWCGSREEAERMAGWFFKRWIELRQREEAGARAAEST